jgi:phosphatidylglycerol lysyltransferase
MEARENGAQNSGQHRLMDAALPSATPSLNKQEKPDVIRARELVLRHGWNSTSFQIVNPGIKRWFSAVGDAVTGYVPAAGVRVVVGAPVCPSYRLEDVVREFESDSAAAGHSVCYFAAETRLESAVGSRGEHSKFLIGAQPTWDPHSWPRIVKQNRSLRAQVNRARNKGVIVTEWSAPQASSDEHLASVLRRWLSSKGLPPLHFMVETNTLARLENRRVFVAACPRGTVGFVVLSPVAERQGWLFEQFPHVPGAPNGTVELMIDTAMRAIAGDGCSYATLGLSPLSTRADVVSLKQSLWLDLMLTWVRKHGRRFYNFDGLDSFKAKLKPESWEPVYAVVNKPQVSPRDLYAIASVFSGNAPFTLMAGAIYKAAETELRWLKRRFAQAF